MAINRVTVWVAGNTLTAAALNGEFNNILDNALSLISPLTGDLDFNNNELNNLGSGTEATPAINFSGDTNTGIRRSAADTLELVTAGADRWQVTSAGHFFAVDDATYDIGASGATRPRNYYGSGTGIFGGALTSTVLNLTAATNQLVFDSDAAVNTGTHTMASLTAARTWTWPDVTGTVALLGETRRLYIFAARLDGTNPPAEGLVGDYPTLDFDGAGTTAEVVRFLFEVPPDMDVSASSTFNIGATMGTSSATNVRVSIDYVPVAAAEALTTAPTTVATTITPNATLALYTRHAVGTVTGATFVNNDIVSVEFSRIPSHADDTHAGDLRLALFWLEYTTRRGAV